MGTTGRIAPLLSRDSHGSRQSAWHHQIAGDPCLSPVGAPRGDDACATGDEREHMPGLLRWTTKLLVMMVGGTVIGAGGGLPLTPVDAATLSGTVVVASYSSLNVRSGPSTTYAIVRRLPSGAGVAIDCQIQG